MASKRTKEGFGVQFKRKRKNERITSLLAAHRRAHDSRISVSELRSRGVINVIDPNSNANFGRVSSDTDIPQMNEYVDHYPNQNNTSLVLESLDNTSHPSFARKLASWAVNERVTHNSLQSLLRLLKSDVTTIEDLQNLPSDPRTLLNTPSSTNIISMGSGLYYYFGIKYCIDNLCKKFCVKLSQQSQFKISVNIDGVPLFKSTNQSFWPILCLVKSIDCLKSEVFCVALYLGNSKPDSNEYLKDFVEESIYLSEKGISINAQTFPFKIEMLICDAPAKSFILNIKGHNGYYSCTKCTLEGDFENILYFSETNFNKRTNHSFRAKLQPEHHIRRTLIEDIPNFNMIDGVPIDYMHCILLGVMKRLLCHKTFGWIFGKPPFKLRAQKVFQLSHDICTTKKYIPCEFARKPRSILECKRYKATEFRLFLLYTGMIVLQKIISPKYYNNFLCLSLATRILCHKEFCENPLLLNYAEDLLKHFVINSKKNYRLDFVSHNVHHLLHITDCVRLYGPLDNFSAFPFENFMPQLTKNVRKSAFPMQQVIRRLSEIEDNEIISSRKKKEEKFLFEHNNGPLMPNCKSPQYKGWQNKSFTINTCRIGDSFVELKDGTIFQIKNFSVYQNTFVIIGFNYPVVKPFFKKPVESNYFGINVIQKDSNLRMDFLNSIKRKVMILPFEEHFVCLPLVHLND